MALCECRENNLFGKEDTEAEHLNDQNVRALKLPPSQACHVAFCSKVKQSRSNKHSLVTVAELSSEGTLVIGILTLMGVYVCG